MNTELRCSFCNKPEHEVRKLAAGPGVYICDSCVRIAAEILSDQPRRPSRLESWLRRVIKRFVRMWHLFRHTVTPAA